MGTYRWTVRRPSSHCWREAGGSGGKTAEAGGMMEEAGGMQ